jgi:site-specific DNA recombinase
MRDRSAQALQAPLRAAIYARYSSDLQSHASIEDQVRLCRERVEREGWSAGAVYTDAAISGASRLRPGYQKLLEDARHGAFEVVVAEALDRLSRDQEDVAGLYKQLGFAGVKLVTIAEGEISELHVGLKGTMNALFLKDLAAKVRRGLRGRVEHGRSGGGNSYGYDVVRQLDQNGEPVRGERRINPTEAAVVRGIFQAFGGGKSPRAIARQLNADRVPGPRGKTWTASTIHGNRERGTGILNNELYVGRLVWNRLRYIKDPATGKRISKLNASELWINKDLPDLRIVDEPLWTAVKEHQTALALPERSKNIRNALNARHRARCLLSGLLKCGVCGAGYTLIGSDRYGCANHINRGTCDNKRSVARTAIERRVLEGLKAKLVTPNRIAQFVKEFQEEWNCKAMAGDRSRAALRGELDDAERRIGQLMAAIEQGVVTTTTKARLLELESRRDRCQAKLAQAAPARSIPALHPNLAELYRRKVADLEIALNDPACRDEAAMALRGLIDAVVLYPGAKRGEIRAELYGELAALLQLAEVQNGKTRTSWGCAGLVGCGDRI